MSKGGGVRNTSDGHIERVNKPSDPVRLFCGYHVSTDPVLNVVTGAESNKLMEKKVISRGNRIACCSDSVSNSEVKSLLISLSFNLTETPTNAHVFATTTVAVPVGFISATVARVMVF